MKPNQVLAAAVFLTLAAFTLCPGCAVDRAVPAAPGEATPTMEVPAPAGTLSPSVTPETLPADNASGPVPARFVPGGVYRVGDEILISGTTILSPKNPLLVEVQSVAFFPTNKTDPAISSGITAVIEVTGGESGEENTWRYLLDTSGFVPGEYLIEISGLKVTGFRESASFSLLP